MPGYRLALALPFARVLKVTTIVLLVGVLVLLLAGCGEESGGTATSSALSAPTQSSLPVSAAKGP